MEDTKPLKTHLNFGVIIALVSIVMFVLYYALDLKTTGVTGLLPTLVFVVLIVVAVINHAKALNGNTKFGDLFAIGFKTTAVVTVIYVLFLIIFLLLVPTYKEHMMEVTRQAMEKKNNMTPEQIDTAMKYVTRFFTASTIAFSILGYLVVGSIASLIGAGLAKKNPQQQRQNF